jgi:diguanylate cyclase (GGDEF)-like protein
MTDEPKARDPLQTGEHPALPMDPHAPTERPPPSSVPPWIPTADTFERTTEKSLSVAKDPKRDRATLTVLSGFNAGQVFALDQPEHILGRGTEADIWAEDPAISRKHAKITRASDGKFVLEDLGSTNGTFLGARRCTTSELTNGDRVQLGPNLLFRFAIVDDREEELQRRLYESSTRDALTRAYNKKYFGERLGAEIAHARRHALPLSVVMLDLDDFKKTNDTHGHLTGDLVLRVSAAQLMRLLRVEDVLARWGGEEFVILARGAGRAEAARLAERMRESLVALTIPVRTGERLGTTASFGVASIDEVAADATASDLLSLADARLLRAKSAGKNRVVSEE